MSIVSAIKLRSSLCFYSFSKIGLSFKRGMRVEPKQVILKGINLFKRHAIFVFQHIV